MRKNLRGWRKLQRRYKNLMFIIFRLFLDYVHKVVTRNSYDKSRIS